MNLNSPNCQQHQISIPSSHDQRRRQPVPLNLPLRDLIVGSREDYNEICVPLYNAALNGNIKDVQTILNNRRNLVPYCITKSYETVLHIAVLGKSYSLLEYLLSFMETKDLELQNANGQTALCFAAIEGVVEIAKLLVESNNALLDIPNNQGELPLYLAAFFGNHEMVEYLFSVQKINGDVWTHESRGSFFLKCIEADMLGIALQIVEDHPELAIDMNPIRVLARKPKAFEISKPSTYQKILQRAPFQSKPPSKELQSQKLLKVIWRNIMKLPEAKVNEIIRGPTVHPLQQKDVPRPKSSSHVLFIAAEMGNTAFVADLIRRYPDIASEVNDNNQTIFHIAVLHRHMGIYMLLHEIGTLKDSIITLEDKNGNNMLHFVGMLREDELGKHIMPQKMRAGSLCMPRELLWFKEVKAILPPSFQERKNLTDDLTPCELFTKNHTHIISKDKEWLKGTIEQLMVVGALTASVTFAASITFAGGYNQDTGSPMLSSNNYFGGFLVFTAASFAFSCVSILIGLSILISSNTEEDLLERIPKRLTIAVTSIFYSITYLLAAMFFNLLLLFENKSIATPIIIMLLFYTPVLLLAMYTFPVRGYSYDSVFNKRSIFDHKKRILYTPSTQI